MSSFIILALLGILSLGFGIEETVRTGLGDISGKRDGAVIAFLGIPFAEPPTGLFRFRPPRPKAPWAPATLKAHSYSSECLQSSLYSTDESPQRDEDCLYINVWVPAKPKEKGLLPVMFWVYGGAFMHGSASKAEYVGDQLAARGVIVVSCNYRMGALGFLVSTSDGLFGNYGLADQKLAMMWVQDHVRSFGGDPTRVTLFGESAGAMSIGLHFLDQHYQQQRLLRKDPRRARKWLFHAIVLQSNPLGYKYRAVTVANFLGAAYKDRLDCEDLRCLQSESADELMHVQDTLMAVPRSMGDFFSWGPVMTDQNYWREYRLRPGPESNITVRQPIEALRDLVRLGKRLDVPVLIGTTKDEGRVFVFSAYPTHMPKIVYQAAMFSFFRGSALRVLKQYAALSERESESPYPDFRTVLSTVIGDYLFRCPNQLFASLLTAVNSSVFLYEFALPTRTPGFPCCDGLACHTSELPYVFNQLKVIEDEYSYSEPVGGLDAGVGVGGGGVGVMPSDFLTNSKDSFAFPDIFGAASSWFGGGSGREVGAGMEKRPPRSQIDSNVSSTMSDFWTTFATYGDPNGLPSPPNGYLGSTRPVGAPWWPTLLGALPIGAAVGAHLRVEVGGGEASFSQQADDSMGNDGRDRGRGKEEDSGEDYPIDRQGNSARDRQRSRDMFRASGRGTEDDESDFDDEDGPWDNELTSEVAVDSDGTLEPAVRARRMRPQFQSRGNPHKATGRAGSYSRVGDKKSFFEATTRRRNPEHAAMHFVKFDDLALTEVMLLEKDCTCAMWHSLQYAF